MRETKERGKNRMASGSNAGENISPQYVRRVAREIGMLRTKVMEGVTIVTEEDDEMTQVVANVQGPGKAEHFLASVFL